MVLFLIENVLAGYISQKLLPLEKIKVKELGKSVQPYFHIADFFVLLPQLEELYQKYQKQIVRLAPTAEVALALTDFEESMDLYVLGVGYEYLFSATE